MSDLNLIFGWGWVLVGIVVGAVVGMFLLARNLWAGMEAGGGGW